MTSTSIVAGPRARSITSNSRLLLDLEVLLGIEATVHREPALVRHGIEVRAAFRAPAEHEDRATRDVGRDVKGRRVGLDLVLELQQRLGDGEHPLERVHAFVLSSDVRGLAARRYAQRDRPAVRVPDDCRPSAPVSASRCHRRRAAREPRGRAIRAGRRSPRQARRRDRSVHPRAAPRSRSARAA